MRSKDSVYYVGVDKGRIDKMAKDLKVLRRGLRGKIVDIDVSLYAIVSSMRGYRIEDKDLVEMMGCLEEMCNSALEVGRRLKEYREISKMAIEGDGEDDE